MVALPDYTREKQEALIEKQKLEEKIAQLKNSIKNELQFELKKNEISELNKFFISNSINVNAIIPVRSLEDYFLKITEGIGR